MMQEDEEIEIENQVEDEAEEKKMSNDRIDLEETTYDMEGGKRRGRSLSFSSVPNLKNLARNPIAKALSELKNQVRVPDVGENDAGTLRRSRSHDSLDVLSRSHDSLDVLSDKGVWREKRRGKSEDGVEMIVKEERREDGQCTEERREDGQCTEASVDLEKGERKMEGPPRSPLYQEKAPEVKEPMDSLEEMDDSFWTPFESPPKREEKVEIAVQQQLDEQYERAIEEREILWTARYASVRQSSFLSLLFFAVYLLIGTVFYDSQTDWEIPESLLFSIYSITTVGYGNHVIPDTVSFQCFTIFYIFIGIAALTVAVAQAYQLITLEATRAQYSRDKPIDPSHHNAPQLSPDLHANSSLYIMHFNAHNPTRNPLEQTIDRIIAYYQLTKTFLKTHPIGQKIAKALPHIALILLGAAVVGPIEGWNPIQSIYWAVVSLTTVGYGDFYPTKRASTWFCIFYLPFSIGFMSLFLANVAHFYIKLSNHNIDRIERKMRKKIAQHRIETSSHDNDLTHHDLDDQPPQVYSDAGFDSLPQSEVDLFGAPGNVLNNGARRRDQVIETSVDHANQTMRDVLSMVKETLQTSDITPNTSSDNEPSKPSFALRILVQERLADIIAIDIAGYQSAIEIKENTLSVTIDALKATADKWMIPRRARRAFRSVAFEVLFFVGERALITKGSQALLDLSPIEFHGLFGPLLAAMGDRQTMESWLAGTNILADVEFIKKEDSSRNSFLSSLAISKIHKAKQPQHQQRPHREKQESMPEIC